MNPPCLETKRKKDEEIMEKQKQKKPKQKAKKKEKNNYKVKRGKIRKYDEEKIEGKVTKG